MDEKNKSSALINISDLLGTSAPATRLVNGICVGIGNVLRPFHARNESKVQLRNFQDWMANVDQSGLVVSNVELDLSERTSVRVSAQQKQFQSNREEISICAIQNFKDIDKEKIQEEKEIDIDWINHFWNCAEKISNKSKHYIWGRVLALSMATETTISPRAVSFLQTLSYDEALMVESLSPIQFTMPNAKNYRSGILYNIANTKNKDFRISVSRDLIRKYEWNHIRHLKSIGLIEDTGWAIPLNIAKSEKNVEFHIGNQKYLMSLGADSFLNKEKSDKDYKRLGSIYAFTNLGEEIFTLVDSDPDRDYVEEVSALLGCENAALKEC